MFKWNKKLFALTISLLGASLITGCGKEEDTGGGVVVVSQPAAPTVPFPYGPNEGVFSQRWCPYGVESQRNGIRKCTQIVAPPGVYSEPSGITYPLGKFILSVKPYLFPRLTPFQDGSGFTVGASIYVNGDSGPRPGVYVSEGDRLIFQGVGSYGEASESSFWGFTCSDSDIDDINLNGVQGGTQKFNGTQLYDDATLVPAGLVAQVGEKFYSLGSFFNQTITSSGYLFYGFNSPYENNCYTLRIHRFIHLHCEDLNGRTVSCI